MENVNIGDTIRIINMNDALSGSRYNGREGTVEGIDSLGQLHGTWGGLAVLPEEDEFMVIKRR